jgi:hypothetical protein
MKHFLESGAGGQVIPFFFSGLVVFIIFITFLLECGMGVGINSWVRGQWALWEGLLVGFISWVAEWMDGWMDGLLRLGVRNGMPSRAWIPGIRIDVTANHINPCCLAYCVMDFTVVLLFSVSWVRSGSTFACCR